MSQALKQVPAEAVIVGWDFSTQSVKCLAFDLDGAKLAEVRCTTDLWTHPEGVRELNLMQLEGQAHYTTRAMASELAKLGRLQDWVAGGISATHHTAGRIDAHAGQVRRAICWNDQTLAPYHRQGVERLGGQTRVQELLGGPWAERYSLSHLLKDEVELCEADWKRTERMLLHGPLAAGYLTGVFDVTGVSSAASTGIMNFQSREWSRGMLGALESEAYRELAWQQLPRIVNYDQPIGPLAPHVATEAGITENVPLIYPTSDDQQAGLVGGGAVDDGQMAIVLGTSAVVNSSSASLPEGGDLDVMCLNWGPYLWMRCYSNGALFVERTIEDLLPGGRESIDWVAMEQQAAACPAGSGGAMVLPFLDSEPSLGVGRPSVVWKDGQVPGELAVRYRAALEAVAYLIALGVRAHQRAGQNIQRITVSGGLARSVTMCRILASVIDLPLAQLESDEGPALGAAVTALAAHERHLRRQAGDKPEYSVSDAVGQMVRFRQSVDPVPDWRPIYQQGLREFEELLGTIAG